MAEAEQKKEATVKKGAKAPKIAKAVNVSREGRKGSVILSSSEVDKLIGDLKGSEKVDEDSLLKMLGSGNEVVIQAAVRYIEHKETSAIKAGKNNYQAPFDETTYLAAENALDNVSRTYRGGSAGRANYEHLSLEMRDARYRAKNAKKREDKEEEDE